MNDQDLIELRSLLLEGHRAPPPSIMARFDDLMTELRQRRQAVQFDAEDAEQRAQTIGGWSAHPDDGEIAGPDGTSVRVQVLRQNGSKVIEFVVPLGRWRVTGFYARGVWR